MIDLMTSSLRTSVAIVALSLTACGGGGSGGSGNDPVAPVSEDTTNSESEVPNRDEASNDQPGDSETPDNGTTEEPTDRDPEDSPDSEQGETSNQDNDDPSGPIRGEPVENRYIVALKKEATGTQTVEQIATALLGPIGGETIHVYTTVLNGFVAELSAADAALLAANPLVDFVEQDQTVAASGTQTNATWGLDRSDQPSLPLSSSYSYANNGSGSHIYIIDSGINSTHTEFTGRLGESRNFVGTSSLKFGDNFTNATDTEDCNGHGTHVAGTAAGTNYGIAKGATLHAIRVLGCQGFGANSGLIAGIDWVATNHESPAVANLSLSASNSAALDNAVKNAASAGVVMVVAAGNDASNACDGSPNRVAEAITVGSTTRSDSRSTFSNHGSCVDIFAPGSGITSAWYQHDSQTKTISGTSMAAPHVTGAAALIRAATPGASVSTVFDQILAEGVSNRLTGIASGSPNLLLQVTADDGSGTVEDNAPQADFLASCDALHCSFNAETSSDDNGIASYNWSFGDGGEANGASVKHSYSSNGAFKVKLTITDTAGQSDSRYKTIAVRAGFGAPSTCSGCSTQYSSLRGTFDSDFYGSARGFRSDSGSFKATLSGPADADFDIALQKLSNGIFGSGWRTVASSTSSSSSEDIRYNGTSGTYRWWVYSYSGEGSYKLELESPQ